MFYTLFSLHWSPFSNKVKCNVVPMEFEFSGRNLGPLMLLKTSTESVPGVASWVNIPVPSFGNIQVPLFGHDIFSVPRFELEVQRKCLFKCWVNISVPSFGNIQVPSFGQPIKCSNSKRGDRDYVSTIKLGYRENVSSSVWLTFRSPRLVTFRFPRLVNQSNVSKNHVNQSVSLFEKSA